MVVAHLSAGLREGRRRGVTRAIACACLVLILVIVACDSGSAEPEAPQPTVVSPTPTTSAQAMATPKVTRDAEPTETARPLSTPEPSPVPTPYREPTALPTPELSPEPTAMPTPTGTPLPLPEPAVYSIQGLTAELLDGGSGTLTVQISWLVVNIGGTGGPDTVPVLLGIDGREPEVVQSMPRPMDDNPVDFSVARELEPKIRTELVRAGDVEQVMEFDARVPDIAIASLHQIVVADGSIELLVEVTNEGEVSARDVVVSAGVTPASAGSEDADPIQRRNGTLETVIPGDTYEVKLPFDIPAGLYQAMVVVQAGTPETLLENNQAEASLEVEYVDLNVSLMSSETVSYENDGRGVVDATVSVDNRGVAPSGPIDVGVRCSGDLTKGCSQSISIESILLGENAVAQLTVLVPQGENPIEVFAGEHYEGYRWGDANVQEAVITVPSKPAVSLAMQAEVNVAGYWSNGTAEVEVMASLRNEGFEQIGETQVINVECQQDGEALDDCGGELLVELANGFGPTGGNLPLTPPWAACWSCPSATVKNGCSWRCRNESWVSTGIYGSAIAIALATVTGVEDGLRKRS